MNIVRIINMKYKIYQNPLNKNQRIFHVRVSKRYQFPDNCLVIKVKFKPKHKMIAFFDEGEIYQSIQSNYVMGRINSLTYRHSVNKYAVIHENNLQVIGKTNLVNVIYHLNQKEYVEQGLNDYLEFIKKLHNSGIKFENVY